MYFNDLVEKAIALSASDLHISLDAKIAFRWPNGDLHFDASLAPTPGEDLQALFKILPEKSQSTFERTHRYDAAVTLGGGQRIRLRLSKHHRGWAVACRLLPRKFRTLAEIKAPAAIQRSLQDQSGLIIVSGPTGSGKSSTLAAMIGEINQTQRRRIVTAEDPIEYEHESDLSLVTHKEIPRDVASFEDAVLDSMREDANVVMLGELRDARALRAAVTAADTGMLVLATVHARNTAGAVQRLVDAFPPGEKELARSMLADSLRLFVAQALVKTNDGANRVGAFETLVNTPAVRNLIRTGDLAQLPSVIQTGAGDGMMTLKQSIDGLKRTVLVHHEDADRILRGRHG